VGDGANNYNGDNGAGGWFLYGGAGDTFLENGETILSGNFTQQGIGDFAFRVEECPGYSVIRTWTAADCVGNTSSCSQTITFASLDNNVAGIAMPQASGSNSSIAGLPCAVGTPCDDLNPCTVNDLLLPDCSCAGEPTSSDIDNDGIADASDPCNGLPILLGQLNPITIDCGEALPAFAPQFIMADGSPVTVSYNIPAPGTYDCSSNVTLYATATNVCNESVTVSQTVSFINAIEFICPEAQDVNCIDDITAQPAITGLEGSGFVVDVSYSDQTLSGSACDRTIARTYYATFYSENSSFVQSCTVVHRIADFEAPVFINPPADATYQCIEEVPAAMNIEAVDQCSETLSVEFFAALPQRELKNILCSQTIERRWAATDACGNAAYHTQMITVEDTTAPVFTNCPANITVQCATDQPAMVNPSTLIAVDNCSGPVTVIFISADTTGTIATIPLLTLTRHQTSAITAAAALTL